MRELDHHPEPVSLHDCAVCQDRGIEVESREYCQACYRGKRRKNVDSFADKLRGLPFTDAMWIVAHSTINTERAIAAAELALLESKLLQAERELAEVRKDAWQPIENAPRDGRSILIRFGLDGVSQAKYIAGTPFPWQFIDTQNGISWMINHAKDGPAGPSHYMPMPSY